MRYHEPAVGLKLTCEARDLVAHGVALRCGQGVELLLQDVGGLHQIPVFIERSESVVETAWRDFVIAKTCVIEQLIEHAGLSERGHTRERRLMRVGHAAFEGPRRPLHRSHGLWRTPHRECEMAAAFQYAIHFAAASQRVSNSMTPKRLRILLYAASSNARCSAGMVRNVMLPSPSAFTLFCAARTMPAAASMPMMSTCGCRRANVRAGSPVPDAMSSILSPGRAASASSKASPTGASCGRKVKLFGDGVPVGLIVVSVHIASHV